MFDKKKGRCFRYSAEFCLTLCLTAGLAGCAGAPEASNTQESMKAELMAETKTPVIGLILTSRDSGENESAAAGFEEMAQKEGVELLIYTPDVSAEDAEQAGDLETGTFASCDVDPIEYQMLAVNEFVAEGTDVIAVHANHPEALEGVLAAARGVGVQICAWGCQLTEESCDVYVETAEEASAAALELLKAGGSES